MMDKCDTCSYATHYKNRRGIARNLLRQICQVMESNDEEFLQEEFPCKSLIQFHSPIFKNLAMIKNPNLFYNPRGSSPILLNSIL